MPTNFANDPFESTHTLSTGPKLFEIAWQRKSLLFLGVLIGLGAGFFYYLQAPPQFKASSQMMVLKRKAEPVSISTGGDSRMSYIEDYMATQEALIQSHEVLRRAAKKLEDKGLLNSPPPDGEYIGLIAKGLKVVRPKDSASGVSSNILNISYQGPSPADCSIILNSVVEGYRDSISGAISSVTDDNLKQIVKGREEIEKKLADNMQEYQRIHERVRAISPLEISDLKSRINVNEGKRSDLLARRIELENRLQLLLKGIRNGEDRNLLLTIFDGASPNRKMGATTDLPRSENDALLSLKMQEDELLQRVGPGHPDVIAIRQRRESMKQHFQRPPARSESDKATGDGLDLFMQILVKEVEVNNLQTNKLESLLEEDRALVMQLDGNVLQEANLRQQGERWRKQLEYIDDRKQQADLMRDAPLFDARVITPAGIGAKVSPILLTTLALAGLLGIVFGVGLACLANVMDKSFRSVQDAGQRLGLTVIGDVPVLTAHEPAVIVKNPVDPLLVVHHLPKSPEAEAFRGIRTSIYFSTHGKGHQVIQVTSPSPGDGKSTLISNLACAIAQSGKRVILIDADFRKPRIHSIFGVSSDVGLASVITGEAKLQAAIQSCDVPGLSILPCGPRPANPADLLSSALFEDILGDIKKLYDFILIDTPPLLVVSDPSAVAPRVDAVILAVRLRKNDRPAAMRAKERLAVLGTNILGIVVNGTAENRKGYGYGYGYSYEYRYESYGDDVESKAVSSLR